MIAENVSLLGGPFDTVFDVGGNRGDFAEEAVEAWPDARVFSFEPIPVVALANAERSLLGERWSVYTLALSDRRGEQVLRWCRNQDSASTMQKPGSTRAEHFGIVDRFHPITVHTATLDDLVDYVDGRLLVKIDVEGHEGKVIAGGGDVLSLASTVVCEVQADASIFLGSPSPAEVDDMLQACGLTFMGKAGELRSPDGTLLQYDGVWVRASATPRKRHSKLRLLQSG